MNLRPYQRAAVDATREALRLIETGRRSVVLVMPTGGGKTITAAEIVRRAVERGHRAVWIAHGKELIYQAAWSLRQDAGLSVGVVAAFAPEDVNTRAPVQVCSVDTLAARPNDFVPGDLVIVDECHRAVASEYAAVLDRYQFATMVGLTATPERGDGTGLAPLFQRLVSATTIRELTEAGHLVPCHVVAPPKPLRSGQIAQHPVDAWNAHAKGRSTIVYCHTLRAAAEQVEAFRFEGVNADWIEGGTPTEERRARLAAFKAGELTVLVNVGTMLEGVDAPIASCAILARGCGTEGLYLQICGRILRPHPGKTDAILIDLRGVSHVHGHPSEDRRYSLEGRAITHGAEAVGASFCRVCGAIVTPGEPCEECGTAAAQIVMKVTQTPLERYAHMRKQAPSQRARNLAKWIATARERGYKQGWIGHRYRVLYGMSPPTAIMDEAHSILRGGAHA